MKTDFGMTAIGIIFCLVLSGAGIFYVMNALDQKLKENAEQQINSNCYGPLDDAMADLAGIPRRPKPEGNGLPEPLDLDFSFD